jgi:sulfate transport system permease protein
MPRRWLAVGRRRRGRGRRTPRRAARIPSLGYTVTYLSLLVLVRWQASPSSTELGWGGFWAAISAWALAAQTFGAAFVRRRQRIVRAGDRLGAGALRFPGKGFVDALVDLPFALPTAVAGIP